VVQVHQYRKKRWQKQIHHGEPPHRMAITPTMNHRQEDPHKKHGWPGSQNRFRVQKNQQQPGNHPDDNRSDQHHPPENSPLKCDWPSSHFNAFPL
ncbi:MAG: hypothetical protein ACF8OB_11790, partial [Phycisphaeraceae bacterium JB051]